MPLNSKRIACVLFFRGEQSKRRKRQSEVQTEASDNVDRIKPQRCALHLFAETLPGGPSLLLDHHARATVPWDLDAQP
jgi:hypothetical protein